MKDTERNPGCELGKLYFNVQLVNIQSHAF